MDTMHAKALLAEIAADRSHGAAELARMGLGACAVTARAWRGDDGRTRRRRLRALVRGLHALRPSMAPIGNWAIAFHDAVEPALEAAGDAWIGAVGQAADRLAADQLKVSQRMTRAGRERVAKARRIVTLSRSSSVLRLLRDGSEAEVIVAESRPGLEGRAVALELHRRGHSVSLVTDAQIPRAVHGADLVLIGADTICRDLAAVNKAGSWSAALAARAAVVPFLVLADSYKINPLVDGASAPLEDHDAREVWPEQPELARNPYFEPVPAPLIDGYVTEHGVLTPGALKAHVTRWAERYRHAGLVRG